jgi:hypothetical protein
LNNYKINHPKLKSLTLFSWQLQTVTKIFAFSKKLANKLTFVIHLLGQHILTARKDSAFFLNREKNAGSEDFAQYTSIFSGILSCS